MHSIDLYITKNSCGSRYSAIAVMVNGDKQKAIGKFKLSAIAYSEIFESAVNVLKKPCQINLFTNCKAFDVNNAVLRENVKNVHKVIYSNKRMDVIDRLKFVAYELALQQTVDEWILKEAVKVI